MKNKNRYIALVLLAIIGTAILTNPPREKHEQMIADKAKQLLKEQLRYEHQEAIEFGMQLFGDQLVKRFMKDNVRIDNYYLFSTTRVRWQSQEAIIGIGAFGNIWFSSKVDEKITEVISVLKKI